MLFVKNDNLPNTCWVHLPFPTPNNKITWKIDRVSYTSKSTIFVSFQSNFWKVITWVTGISTIEYKWIQKHISISGHLIIAVNMVTLHHFYHLEEKISPYHILGHICSHPINKNTWEIINLIRIFQRDGVNEFITINFMPNSLVDCQMVFLTNPCCIHHWL